MDPVTAVGLVASVLQLIDTATKVLVYLNDVKEASSEQKDLSQYVLGLMSTLNMLRSRVEESMSSSDVNLPAIKNLGVENGPLDQIKMLMERLAKKLKPSTGRMDKAGKLLKWPFDKKEVKDVIEQIDRVNTLVALAIQSDNIGINIAMKKDVSDLKRSVETKQEEEEFQKINTWLSSLDFAAKQTDIFHRMQPGTGQWLLYDPQFEAWADGNTRILWCPGQPGAGKTTLASLVIHWLQSRQQNPPACVLYLYCSYKYGEAQTLENTLGSLLSQILQHKWAISDGVRKLFRKYHQTRPPRSDLMSTLVDEMGTCQRVYIIIDALDEYPDSDGRRDEFMTEVKKLTNMSRVLITSRYSVNVQEVFENASQLDIRAREDDVRKYVKYRISKDRCLVRNMRMDTTLGTTIPDAVVRNCQGMFLLAQLHMDNLAKALTVRKLRQAINSLPKKLDETYDQAMQRIASQDEYQCELAYRILYWVSYSMRPLTVLEMQHALAVEPGDEDLDRDGFYDEELIVSVCAGLVTMDEKHDKIWLVHYTAQTYLERIRTEKFPTARQDIARTCLTYLTFRPFIRSSYMPFGRRIVSRYAFMSYAVEYWAIHVRDLMDDEIKDLIQALLDNKAGLIVLQYYFYSSAYTSPTLANPEMNFENLHLVAFYGLENVLEDVLVQTSDVNATTSLGRTPLHFAAGRGHLQIVYRLLKAGAKVEGKQSRVLYAPTPLHYAVQSGHTPVIRALIEAGADCNSLACDGQLPRHKAAFTTIRLLVTNGERIELNRLSGTPLHTAAEMGDGQTVRLLLAHGARVSARSERNRTPLHHSSLANDAGVAKILLEGGADVSAADSDGNTPLHVAVDARKIEVVRVLMQYNADIYAENAWHLTPIGSAISSGLRSIVDVLLEHVEGRAGMEQKTQNYRLLIATMQNDLDMAKTLLSAGADPNWTYSEDACPLCYAVDHKSDDMMNVLFQYEARGDILGNLPLRHAVVNDYTSGVQMLLDHGADVEAAWNGETAMGEAITRDNLATAILLIERGAQVQYPHKLLSALLRRDKRSNVTDPIKTLDDFFRMGADVHGSPFAILSSSCDEDTAVMFMEKALEKGANVNGVDVCGSTALQLAVAGGKAKLVSFLLQHGADIHQKQEKDGSTAVHFITYRSGEVAQILIDNGADLNAIDAKGLSVLHHASRLNNQAVVDMLLKKGVDINFRCKKRGATALHYAVKGDGFEAARFLLKHGADVTAMDIDGKTPLDYAKDGGLDDMVELMEEYDKK